MRLKVLCSIEWECQSTQLKNNAAFHVSDQVFLSISFLAAGAQLDIRF